MNLIKVFISLAWLCIICSCSNNVQDDNSNGIDTVKNKQALQLQIDSLEKKMYSEKMEINRSIATFAMKCYDDFATMFPNDKRSPEYLFKAGELANSMQYAEPALIYLKKLNRLYPSDKNVVYSMLMQGIIYQDMLNDTANARIMYLEVMKKNAGSQLAKDAEASIKNLGKTPEQLIREFEKENEASSKK